jgi:Hypothetical glycosyl hydrolase family 15
MKFKSLATLGASVGLTLSVMTAYAANPFGIAFKYETNVTLYAKPTGVVITGRCNLYDAPFQTVRTKGGEVLFYINPASMPDYYICAADKQFYMNDYGRVPLWPWPSYGQRILRPGNHLVDIRAGGAWSNYIVNFVVAKMKERKFDGVFVDTCGGRPWSSYPNWANWPLAEKNAWTDGCVDLVRRLDAQRRAINPNFIIVNNNVWDRSDGNTRGLVAQKYVDGITLEHPACCLQPYHVAMAGRTFGNLGHRRVLVIANSATEAQSWAKIPGVTHVANQPTAAYGYPLAPVVSFTPLNDR